MTAVFCLLLAAPARAADVFLSLTRSDLPISDAPTNVDVIKAGEIDRTTAKTAADAIEGMPGVMIRRSGSLGSAELAALRGFSSKQVLVVIDDVAQQPDLTGTVDLSRIPLDNVDRIELVRGGASAVYGPNAEGGVIHIITKQPSTKVDAKLVTEAGSFGTYHNLLSAAMVQGPLRLQATASHDSSRGFQQNSQYKNSQVTGLAAYDAGQAGRISYQGSTAQGRLGLPSGTPVPIDRWNGSAERQANALTTWQSETDSSNRLQYENRFHGLEITARVANNVVRREVFEFGFITRIRTEGRNASAKIENRDIGALGYDYHQRRLNSNIYGDHRADAWGAFAQSYLLSGDRVRLTPGLRYDRDNQYGATWSPRIQLVAKLNDACKLSASANRSFQAPTFADLFDPFVPPAYQNAGLRPEKTWSYDAGVAVRPGGGLEFSATGYRTDTQDRIALDPNRGFAAFNLDSAYTRGVEFAASHRAGYLFQSANWTYLDAKGKKDGSDFQTLAFSPRHAINYKVDLRLPLQTGLTLAGRFVDEQWTRLDQAGMRIPGHFVANIKVIKKIGWVELFAACDNLLDRRYAETADAFNGYFPRPGRTYSGGVSLRFMR